MLIYVCQHCLKELGELVEGEPEPICTEHPDGAVEVMDYADYQTE